MFVVVAGGEESGSDDAAVFHVDKGVYFFRIAAFRNKGFGKCFFTIDFLFGARNLLRSIFASDSEASDLVFCVDCYASKNNSSLLLFSDFKLVVPQRESLLLSARQTRGPTGGIF